MCIVLPAVLFSACGETPLKFTFSQGSITIQEGRNYDPYAFIKESLTSEEKEKVTFKIADSNIAIINDDNQIEIVAGGMTEIIATVNGKKVCQSILIVEKAKTPLSAPVNIHYDEDKHALVWNPVYVQDANGVFTATTYKIEVVKNGSSSEVSNDDFACEYSINQMGTYTVRVKTVGNSSFADSPYSETYTFSITSAPSELAYNNLTNELSWSANGNGSNVSYIVHYDVNGVKGSSEELSTTSYTLPALNVGKHSVFVEAVSSDDGWFGNTSQKISLTKLESPTLAFNNGVLTWNAVEGADDYMLSYSSATVDKNVPLTTTTYTFTNLSEGEYTVSLVAQSEQRYVFSSPSSELVFTKLPLAILKFDLSTRTFAVENGVGESYKIHAKLNDGENKTSYNSKLLWDITDYDAHEISAQIFATNPANQMDGDVATTFSVNDTTNLSKMQNLKAPELYYTEENGNAVLKFTAITAGCLYGVSVNKTDMQTVYENGKIVVGQTSELYATGNTFAFDMKISKTNANGTYFIDAKSSLIVQKLASPTALGFNADRTKVVSIGGATESIVTSKIEYKINEDNGIYDLNLTDGTLDTSKNSWIVKVRLFASDFNELIGGCKTYYTASDVSSFEIQRLDAPENFAYSYTNQKFNFDDVENASSFIVSVLGQNLTTTETYVSYNAYASATASVVASPSFANILKDGKGYYYSLPTTCEVFQTEQISSFKLSKDLLDGRIIASWTEPDNAEEFVFVVEYEVYVDGVLKATIADTSYKFDASQFLDVKTYEISVKIKSPNSDFSVPKTFPTLEITKLEAPTQIDRSLDTNILRVQNFASSKMANVVVNGKRIAENSTSKTFELTLNEGESKNFEVYFEGIFDSSLSKYYINSDSLTFSVSKLQSATGLDLEITERGNVFTWTSLDKDLFPDYVAFEYYTSEGGIYSSVQTITETTKTIANQNAFTFYVKEVAKNPNWTSITENNSVLFLSSDNTLSFDVVKENDIEDMLILAGDSTIKFLWNYAPADGILGYVPKFIFEMTAPNSGTSAMTLNAEDCLLATAEEGRNYGLEIPLSNFAGVGDYECSAYATSSKTLDGDKTSTTLTKLASVDFVSVQETSEVDASGNHISSFKFVGDQNGSSLGLDGVRSLEVSGDLAYSGLQTQFSLEDLNSSGVMTITVKLIGKNLVSEISGNHYFLNSDESSFTFQKTSTVDCVKSAESLTWDMASVPAGVDFAYNLEYAYNDGQWQVFASDISDNFISLSDSRLTTTFSEAGDYDVKVKATLNKTLQTYSKTFGVIFVSSNFGNSEEIIKLETPTAPEIVALNEAQTTIQISWTAVALAEKYNIFITLPNGEVQTYFDITGTTFETTTDFNSAGSYTVKIQATAEQKISSSISSGTQIARLDKATALAISGEYYTTYGVSSFANNYAGEFTFTLEILDANGVANSTIKDISARNIDISQDVFLSAFNDGAFGLQITLIGNKTTTLTSEKLKISAYKFLAPTISIVENQIQISSADSSLYDFAEIWFEIKDTSKTLVALQKYTSAYTIPENFEAPFTVNAFVKSSGESADSQNFTQSNTTVFGIDARLSSPQNVTAQVAGPAHESTGFVTQENVNISWDAVANADYYELYINGVMLESDLPLTSNSITLEQQFGNAGKYEIKVVARANDNFLTSKPSNAIQIVRLNSINNAYIDADGVAHFTPSGETAYFTGYYFEVLASTPNGYQGNTHSVELDKTLSTHSDILDAYLSNPLAVGEFAFDIRVYGNAGGPALGTWDGTLVLNSASFRVFAYKLSTPTIDIQPNFMSLAFTDGDVVVESNNAVVSSLAKNYVNITSGSVSILSNYDMTGYSYYYPNTWASGEYDFAFQSKPKSGVLNVVSSDIGTHTATRLEAPKEIEFVRETLTNTDNYSSDVDVLEYLSSKTFLEFKGEPLATSYTFKIGSTSLTSQENTESFEIYDEFEAFLNGTSAGQKTLYISSNASGGDYFNSPTTTITFTTQSSVANFKSASGVLSWSSSGSTNTSAYLVRAVDGENTGLHKFWQSKGKVFTSELKGILDGLSSGQINLNIKALGNITTEGISSSVILDSAFLVSDQTFTKLMATNNLKTHLGFLCFDVVPGATYYIAKFDNGTSSFTVRLSDFSNALNFTSETQMVANFTSSSVKTDTLYTVSIRAMSSSSKVLYSDYNENPIKIKLLENANAKEDISLTLENANGDLSKKQFRLYASAGAYGVLLESNGQYQSLMLQNQLTNRAKVTFSISVLMGGGYLAYNFASIGSSDIESGGFYFLTSTFTKSKDFYILAEPVISVNVDTIEWTSIDRADGYYLYINGNQYKKDGDTLLRDNFLVVPSEFGGNESVSLDVRVIAVSSDMDVLFSPEARYMHSFAIGNDKYADAINLQKMQIPDTLSVFDGALMFGDGVSSLDTFNQSAFESILSNMKSNPSRENFSAFENYLASVFNSSSMIFSPYTGFNLSDFTISLTNTYTNVNYEFEIGGEHLLKFTQSQLENFNTIVNLAKTALSEVQSKFPISYTSSKALYTGSNRVYASEDEFMGYYIRHLKNLFENASLVSILSFAEKGEFGYPTIRTLFEELSTQTAVIPAGEYNLSLCQNGNTMDWLSSNFTELQTIYIPFAPTEVHITEVEGDFMLVWNSVNIPVPTYEAIIDSNTTSNNTVYIIYAEDNYGNRFELLRTEGLPTGTDGQLMANLSDLVDEEILLPKMTKIFVVSAGDSTNVVIGKKSNVLDVTVLPQLTPYMKNGTLNWNSLVASKEYEVITKDSINTNRIVQAETSWIGDELTPSTRYRLALRALGSITQNDDGDNVYVISGKVFECSLTKLGTMDVSVNKFGQFEWQKITNALGFIVDIPETESYYVVNKPDATTYEAEDEGFNTFCFRALGSNNNLMKEGENYFMSSKINNDIGIKGHMLSAVDGVFVEDGYLKWIPLGNDGSVNPEGDLIKTIGYRLALNKDVEDIYSTELTSQIISQQIDDAGNFYFDFTNYGTAGSYVLMLQPYLYFENSTKDYLTNAMISHNGQSYYQLLGTPFELNFKKATPPTNIRIQNGELVWNSAESLQYFVQIFLASNNAVVKEYQLTEKAWWTDEEIVNSQELVYKAKIKTYQENSVFSGYAQLVDIYSNAISFGKIPAPNVEINTYSGETGNFIEFDYPQSGIQTGFNIKYKANDSSEFKYVLTTDSNYNSVVKYANGKATIDINAMGRGIKTMTYSIQVVPLGNSKYLKSNWSESFEYATPNALDAVYFDEAKGEFYWAVQFQDKNSTGENALAFGYVVKDEIYSGENLVATYYYNIASGVQYGKEYYEVKQIGGKNTPCIVFSPVVVGYTHKVAVAVSLNPGAEQTLMSFYTECETTFENNLFGASLNLFAETSELFDKTTSQTRITFLKQNAYGSSANPLKVNSANFDNLNKRLAKYEYLNSYTVVYMDKTTEVNVKIQDESTTLTFALQGNIAGVKNMIGERIESQGFVDFKGFANTLDGQGFTVTYSITALYDGDKLGLFRQVEASGIVKNLKVKATIDFNSITNASQVAGGVVAENYGLITNVRLSSLTLKNAQGEFTIGLSSLTLGGIVGINYAKVEYAIAESTATISTRADGVVSNPISSLYIGGIVGKNNMNASISYSGNNASIDAVGTDVWVGGVSAYSNGSVVQAYNKASISITTSSANPRVMAGGVVGMNDTLGSLTSCYNKGSLAFATASTNNVAVGGLVGYSYNYNISNSFSTSSATQINSNYVGGTLFGKFNSSFSSSAYQNYYFKTPYISNNTSLSNFAKDASGLTQIALISALNASGLVFVNGSDAPIFKWEQNLT